MAVEPGDALFVSKLDESSKQKAKDELNEINPKDRELAVQTLRQWVLQQDWLRTPTDFSFLLRFLRARKFSQLRARQILENYWTTKTKAAKWFRDIDPLDPKVVEVLRTGIYLLPKRRDKYGRRVLIERMGQLDLDRVKKDWGIDFVYKVITMVCDLANRDENVQVNGIVMISDLSHISMSMMLTIFDKDRDKLIMDFFQDALPLRMKGFNMYNEPSFFDAMYALFSPLLKQKIKDRMKLHGRSLTKIYEDMGMECLPEEYLPDDYTGPSGGSVENLVEEMIADVQSPDFVAYIKDLSSDKYGVDLQKKKQMADEPAASFRKLNVD